MQQFQIEWYNLPSSNRIKTNEHVHLFRRVVYDHRKRPYTVVGDFVYHHIPIGVPLQ